MASRDAMAIAIDLWGQRRRASTVRAILAMHLVGMTQSEMVDELARLDAEGERHMAADVTTWAAMIDAALDGRR